MVYLAYDHDCNRQVAIKKIRPEFRNDPLVISRFHAEAELTSGLEHPGIIPIYAKGEIDKAIADQLKALEFIEAQTKHIESLTNELRDGISKQNELSKYKIKESWIIFKDLFN